MNPMGGGGAIEPTWSGVAEPVDGRMEPGVPGFGTISMLWR